MVIVGKYDEGERDDERDTDYSRYYVPLKFSLKKSWEAIPNFYLTKTNLRQMLI